MAVKIPFSYDELKAVLSIQRTGFDSNNMLFSLDYPCITTNILRLSELIGLHENVDRNGLVCIGVHWSPEYGELALSLREICDIFMSTSNILDFVKEIKDRLFKYPRKIRR